MIIVSSSNTSKGIITHPTKCEKVMFIQVIPHVLFAFSDKRIGFPYVKKNQKLLLKANYFILKVVSPVWTGQITWVTLNRLLAITPAKNAPVSFSWEVFFWAKDKNLAMTAVGTLKLRREPNPFEVRGLLARFGITGVVDWAPKSRNFH